MLILGLLPSFIWLSLKQIHSPWWLENILSTPFIILAIYTVLIFPLIYFVPYQHCIGYFFINFIFAIYLNNASGFSNLITLNNKVCTDPVTFFQFNMKYTENAFELDELIEHLIAGQYHLIALQGVSQKSKKQIVERLNPYYPYFIRGESDYQQVYTDQLLFSHYAFSSIKYYKNGHNAFLISSLWQLPFNEINLHTLHPPSPRNESLWQVRNKTLYQLKHALKASSLKNSLVIGDLNISKHSSRIKLLNQGMNTQFINSWPKKPYVFAFLGLVIDHLWVSKPANICTRQRINKFSWSDHYAIKSKVDFKS